MVMTLAKPSAEPRLSENRRKKNVESSSNRNKRVKALLHSLFYDVAQPSAYTGKERVYRAARRALSSITRADVDDWFENQVTYTLHKPVRLRFARNKTIVKSIDEQWQADLCDMQSRSRANDGHTFILTCIDCFSKYAWAETLRNKTGDEIVAAMTRMFASGRKPKRLQTDKGSEFTNVKVQVFLRKHNVEFFTTNSEQKASIVERFNRTLKTRMFKYFTAENTYRYMDVLPALIRGYNSTYHRSIKMQPRRVRRIHQPLIRQRLYGKQTVKKTMKKRKTVLVEKRVRTYKYAVGAWVRITRERQTFSKGYEPHWSEEVFVIRDRRIQRQPVYYLRDWRGEEVSGAFYEEELQRIGEPSEYRVEKVLRTRKRRDGTKEHLVQWKGYDKSFNSWVTETRKL